MEFAWQKHGRLAVVDEALMRAMRAVDDLGARIQAAMDAADLSEVRALHGQLRAAEARRDELLAAAVDEQAPPSDSGAHSDGQTTPARSVGRGDAAIELPVRETVLDALTVLGRPAGVSLMNEVIRVRGGHPLAPSRVASLRRDEARSWTSSATRPAYVVPALSADRFTPVRGMLATSAWPLSVRILAPASGRVDLLHSVAALAQAAAEDRRAAPRSPYEQVLWRLARTIPNAVDGDLDPERVRDAALAELEVHRDGDEAERQSAADRARAQLDVKQLLFGANPKLIRNPGKEA